MAGLGARGVGALLFLAVSGIVSGEKNSKMGVALMGSGCFDGIGSCFWFSPACFKTSPSQAGERGHQHLGVDREIWPSPKK